MDQPNLPAPVQLSTAADMPSRIGLFFPGSFVTASLIPATPGNILGGALSVVGEQG